MWSTQKWFTKQDLGTSPYKTYSVGGRLRLKRTQEHASTCLRQHDGGLLIILRLRPCRRPPYMQEPADLQCCQLWAISVRCLNWDIMWVSLCWEWSDYYHRQECSLFDRNCKHIILHVMWEYNLFRAIHSFLLEATWRHWCTVEWGGRFLQPSEAKAIVNLLNIHRFKLKVKQIF